MATTTRVLDANVNGAVYTSNANSALEALDTCHSGATAPTDEVANGKLWLDTSTTPGILKIYNNATWEVVHDDSTLHLDSSGNVGIGTTTPDEALEVNGDLKISGSGFGIVQFGETSDQTKIVGRDGSHATQPNTMEFYTNSAEAMRIDASGNVGIGTTTPIANLDVFRGGIGIVASFSGDGVAGARGLQLIASTTTNVGDTHSINAQSSTGILKFSNNNNTERMRIHSSGNLAVGTTIDGGTITSAAGSNAYSIYTAGSSVGYNIVCRGDGTTGVAVRILNSVGADVGSIDYTASATTYNTTSDYRLKENVTPIQGAGDIIKAMQPVTYTYKVDGSWMDGFLAHELQ